MSLYSDIISLTKNISDNYAKKSDSGWNTLSSFGSSITLPANAYTAYKEIMIVVVTNNEVVGSVILPTNMISSVATGKYIYVNGWYCNATTNGMVRLYVLDQSKKLFSINKNVYASYYNGTWAEFNVATYGR